MTAPTRPAYDTLAPAARQARAQLARLAPDLLDAFDEALPRAADTVGRRLTGALYREDLGDARVRWADAGPVHGFDRLEPRAAPGDPVARLPPAARALAPELTSAVVNLAIAYARQPVAGPHPAGPDDVALAAERLAVDGHNLHPCGRTRLGWDVADTLRHDVEAGTTTVGFVAVRRDLHVGDDLGAALAGAYPQVPAAPPGYAVQPVHAWQREAVLHTRYADLYRAGALRDLDGELPAAPTAALRTLLLPPGRHGSRRYLKLALDIQVTSTRRSISTASTRNGPVLSRLLATLLADQPRVLLLAETHGAALSAGDGRDGSAILRDGLAGRLEPGETAIPGGGLTVPAVFRTVVDRHPGGPVAFLADYARLLLPPVVTLAARYGIGLEAHLQNCLPTFRAGRPHRIAFRDLAGLRLHLPRLAAAGLTPTLWPGSVVATDDVATMRAKIGYTALQAHLGDVVLRLTEAYDLDERPAWRVVRAALDEAYAPLGGSAGGGIGDGAGDHAALTAPYVPHKALVRMRLTGAGDVYVPVHNPLHDP